MTGTAGRLWRTAVAAACALTLPLVASCAPADSASSGADGKLAVVATTPVVADLASSVGGPPVRITRLLDPNVDPHDFEPSPADLKAVSEADILVVNGVGLESWLDDTIAASGFDGKTVDTSKGVPLRHAGGAEPGHGHHEHGDHEHGAADPHIWHSPANAKIMAGNIAAAFQRADTGHRAGYRARLEDYRARLDALDAYIRRQVATVPETKRKLVTNHDAFGYYLDRYGITFVGSIIPSMDSSAELSGRRLDLLVDEIEAERVPAVFSESSLSPKTASAIADRAGVRVIAGEDSLYGDSLGRKGSGGGTYIAMMKHNTRTIVGGLRG